MFNGRRKLWLILVPVVLLAAFAAGFFWEEIIIRAAPKTVLSGATAKLYSQLEQRFSGSPLRMAAEHLDAKGQYTAKMQLEANNELLGPVRYDMTVRTDALTHQLQAEGAASTEAQDLDMSLYLDRDYMAISSDDLVKGAFYGITYDTFASDIRSIPLLKLMVSDGMLEQWDAKVRAVRSAMEKDYTLPDLSGISGEDVKLFLSGLMLLPGEVTSEKITRNGENVRYYYIRYQAGGDALQEITVRSDGEVTAMFALCRNVVTDLDLTYQAGTDQLSCHFTFGEHPLDQPVSLQAQGTWQGADIDLDVTIATEHSEEGYRESWHISDGRKISDVSFLWDAASGDLSLSANGSDPVLLKLASTEDGLRIYTEDMAAVWKLLTGEDKSSQARRCVMTVSAGSAITPPDYKNLDQWSLEDLTGLLGGLGSLIGLNFE